MGSIIVLRKVVERGLSAMKTPPKYDENDCMIASEGDSPEAIHRLNTTWNLEMTMPRSNLRKKSITKMLSTSRTPSPPI